MERKSNKEHKHIEYFNPDVTTLNKAHQDFYDELKRFSAGNGNENFSEFIGTDEAIEYKENGDGTTHIVWNVMRDECGQELKREIVAYYTLVTTSIPYEDRIRLDEEEAKETGEEFSIEICGISAIEIRMFAVDERYQDVFFEYEGENLPVSAWIIRSIIDMASKLMDEFVGFKALFLHSVPEAENFYETNGFNPIEVNMQPLHSIDSEYKPMYLTLKEIHMNYDE